jgi:hypothetical protein
MFPVSERELEERYMLVRIGATTTPEIIEYDATQYFRGEEYRYETQRAHWYSLRCRLFLPVRYCPRELPARDVAELPHYAELADEAGRIRSSPEEMLKKYHVGIAVFATGDDPGPYFRAKTPDYQDEWYTGYLLGGGT